MLFEIEGVPRREKLFKKNRSYIAVYEDRLHIELDGEHDDIDINDVFDVYIKEPIVEDVTSRTTMV